MNPAPQVYRSIFSTPVRWVVRVLAWLAFLVTAYLAWNAQHGTSVAGCGVGSTTGCDIVLSSGYARWLGLPVSFAGLACYSALAALSVMIGFGAARWSRIVDTLVVFLSVLAAGASVWFLIVQLVLLGSFCPYCVATDLCGVLLGALALWSALRAAGSTRSVRAAERGLMALRNVTVPRIGAPLTAAPSASVTARSPVGYGRRELGFALSGACVLLAVLIGGQLVWPSKTYDLQQIALDRPFHMTGSPSTRTAGKSPSEISPPAETHVAMRIPTESAAGESSMPDPDDEARALDPSENDATTGDAASIATAPENDADNPREESPAATVPRRERNVSFLGGKLTLNVYDHPVIGDPEAPHIMIEMVSYDCPHCRKMHRIVQKGLRRYGNQLAVLIMTVPLERKCNPMVTDPKASHSGACTTSRMAVAVADLNPTAFAKFHDWLMADEEKPPAQDKIVARAFGLVDRERLRELSEGEGLNKQISKYIDLLATLQGMTVGGKKVAGLPIQILGDEVMSGNAENAEDVYRAWEKNLGIKPL